jgi:hypothetical protein
MSGVVTSALVLFLLASPTARAGAAATAYLATFSGTYESQCMLPHSPDGTPTTGAYTCTHTAESTICVTEVDADVASGEVRTCRVALTDGATGGALSTGVRPPFSTFDGWACVNGGGQGHATYAPPDGLAVVMPVVLTVEGSVIRIEGSVVQVGTNRTLVLRGSLPNDCARASAGSGFSGTVSAS